MNTNRHVTKQPMEGIMMNIDWASIPTHNRPSNSGPDKTRFQKLVEVYIDDFIGVLQSTDKVKLRQLSKNFLKGINNVFPPPALTGSTMGPLVSEKKLIEDGTWALRKEVLGWLFDGLARTIELPQKKCKKILADLHEVRRVKQLELRRFQKLHGRLQFASISIPCGKPILGQLDRYLAKAGRTHQQ
jgi:hypothetical protein